MPSIPGGGPQAYPFRLSEAPINGMALSRPRGPLHSIWNLVKRVNNGSGANILQRKSNRSLQRRIQR